MSGPLRRILLAAPLVGCGLTVPLVQADEPAPRPRPVTARVAQTSPTELDSKVMGMIAGQNQIMANLQYLSDVIGPRLTGSRNLERANKWTMEKMESYGLENVRLEPWEIPVGWERGFARMTLIDPNPGRPIMIASSGWTPGTKGKLTGPVVALQARNKEDLAKYKGKLKNAVVMRTPPYAVGPVSDLRYIPGFTPDSPTPPAAGKKDEPKKGPGQAAKEEPKKEAKKEEPPARRAAPGGFGGLAGGADVTDFLIAEGAAAVLTQSSKPHGLIAVSGSWRGTDRGAPQEGLARLVCSVESYGLLWRLATDKGQTPIAEIEVQNKYVPGPIVCYNTVGEIKGSEKPDEFVVIGAHLDSWDLGTGTTDNGTGSCVILECARVFGALAKQGVRPKRTIRFVLYTGEEQGLVGSREYTTRHAAEMPKVSVALVHDTGTGKVEGWAISGRESIKAVLGPELTSLEAVGFKGLTRRFSGGSDHASFERVGVPGFAAVQESDEYKLTHHTQSDTFDKAKEPNLIQGAQVMAVTAMRVANLPDLLPRGDRGAGPPGGGKRGFGEKKEGKKDNQ
jgi:hypothetical protein